MLVDCIFKSDGFVVGLKIQGKFYNFDACVNLYKQGYLENVVLVQDRFFRGKGYNIPVKEVGLNGKRNESGLGQVSQQSRGYNNSSGVVGNERCFGKTRQKGNGVTRKGVSGYSGGVHKRGDVGNKGTGMCSKSESALRLRLKKLGCSVFTNESPSKFQSEFSNAKKLIKNGSCVDEHSLDELKKMKLLRSENGFVAIEAGGNINSVLKDESKPNVKNFLRDLLINALEHGGKKLDCFAITKNNKMGGLAKMYCSYGFIPVVRDRFNRDFAPAGWDYERDGEPDVVFMYHCGDSAETVIKKHKNEEYRTYMDYVESGEVPYIMDLGLKFDDKMSSYDRALFYRDYIMEKKLRYK